MTQKSNFLYQLLKPLLRLALRQGIYLQEFFEVAKRAAVDAAYDELVEQNLKVTTSALSLRTGLRRREVDRIFKREESKETPPSIAARVVGNWTIYDKFKRKSGGGRTLTFKGEDSEFGELVRTVSLDIHPGIVLRELETAGAVKRSARGLALVKQHFDARNDWAAANEILARDVQNLIEAVTENVNSDQDTPNLHGTTYFVNIEPQDLDKIKNWVVKEGSKFHKKVRTYIGKFYRELSPEDENYASGISFYFTTFTRSIIPVASEAKEGDDEKEKG